MVFNLYTTSTSPASADSGPTKPIYLLPSFSIPFRRRRPSIALSPTYHHHLDDTESDTSLPSLSSSPDSFATAFSSSEYYTPIQSNSTTRLSPIQPDILRCAHCASDIAFTSQIISKGFTGRHGRAYLVSPTAPGFHHQSPAKKTTELPNILTEAPESRCLVTGQHTVADITCAVCGTKLGWKYVDAKESSQKYKVGKFILESARVVTFRSWEDSSPCDLDGSTSGDTTGKNGNRGMVKGTAAGGKRKQMKEAEAGEEEAAAVESQEQEQEPVSPTAVVFDSDDDSECDDIFAGVWDAETVAKKRKGKVANLRPHRAGLS
ncbi:yippee zinc-binding/DNA-binding /Mis18, centromere assembly-domain-containing protein [Pseudoneurospora amorphoporcata]|uniref:Yippee zinc-binding/DNA-binding /Mis18, centromere assembly-domain-containing protein n=1 Tax=Pseudoneurospora amorphoporcata TaxID=241081 RepID=A0AAN6NKR0_9PEZI|nr:yippee zinc-binding/DNA-binding /Mis18, centromere assembly-domain-containing protein [Pseudoneurospora amorphoporcata]